MTTLNAKHSLNTINKELNKKGFEMIKRVHFGNTEFITKELAGYCDLTDGVYSKKSDAVERAKELMR
jgi:hypothetical protein